MLENTKEELCVPRVSESVAFNAQLQAPLALPETVTPALINEFAKWIAPDVSAQTVSCYTGTMRIYCIGQPIAIINHKRFFVALKQSLLARGMGLGSVMRHTAAVKRFLVFLADYYDLPIVNLSLIHCKKPPRTNPTYLEPEEIAAIRKIELKTILDLRDRTLFEMFLDTGARCSELININWADIDFEKAEISIVGKGNKHRILRINISIPWIKEYLKQRHNSATPLFLSYQKAGHRLQRQGAHIAIRNLGIRAGLTKKLYPHKMRHSFATYLTWTGTDPKTVQELLGHADLATSMRYYVGASESRMKAAHVEMGKLIGDEGPDGIECRGYR